MLDHSDNDSALGRRRVPRPRSTWQTATTQPPYANEGATVVQLPNSFLDTIAAHYGGSANTLRSFKSDAPTVSLVIPVPAEAGGLDPVLEQVPDDVDEIVLVHDDAADEALGELRGYRHNIRIVERAGQAALQEGLRLAAGDIIVVMAADGRMQPREIAHYLHFLANGYDFVKGSRFICGGGSLGLTSFRRIRERVLLAMFRHRYDTNITDLSYGFAAFHRRHLERLDHSATGIRMGVEMTVRAVQAGLRIAEVPSVELPRRTAGSKLDPIRDGFGVVKTMLRHDKRA
jgi:glycosyltransferase involved in cell wall biosynthesis